MAIKALRAIRGGTIEHPGWEGWLFHQGRIYPPTGHPWEPWEIEQLAALQRQARAFRDLYERFRAVPDTVPAVAPQHTLNLRPEPQAQRSFRPCTGTARTGDAAANDACGIDATASADTPSFEPPSGTLRASK